MRGGVIGGIWSDVMDSSWGIDVFVWVLVSYERGRCG